MPHFSVPLEDPRQGFPPLEGGGLLQRRNFDRIPPPQVTEHELQTPKAPQLPLTATEIQLEVERNDEVMHHCFNANSCYCLTKYSLIGCLNTSSLDELK